MAEREYRHTNFAFPVRHFGEKREWTSYAKWLETHLKVSLGLLPEPPAPEPGVRVFDRWQGDGYTCESVCFQSLPGFYVTGNLFRPAPENERPGKSPGILCPHGHWPDGRLHDHDPRGSVIARCVTLARMGATVFSWDMVGYNDCAQVPHQDFREDTAWGLSLMALQTWNSVCALDFLQGLPEVHSGKIGVTGASGGATQTFTLMAVDPRVTAAAPVCMISQSMQGGCRCENAPLLRLDATNVEIARLFAPKPLFMGSCTQDWTQRTPTVELPAMREVYNLMDGAHEVWSHHVDYEHNYNQEMREAVYGFFNRQFFGARDSRPVRESDFERPPLRNRMVWWGRKAPESLSRRTFHALWRKRAEAALRPHLRDPDTVRRRLGPLLEHVLGITPSRQPAGLAARNGIAPIMQGQKLIIGPRGRAAQPEEKEPFFSTYNLTPLCRRVHEVVAVAESAPRTQVLVGKGSAGLWCLLAGAISSKVRALDVDLNGFDAADDAAWRKSLDTPAIRQIGGLATVFAMVGRRPLTLRNAPASVRRLAQKYARG